FTDLSHFALWWHQAGTPRLTLAEEWEEDAGGTGGTYRLTVRQTVPSTPDQPVKTAMMLPVRYGLLDAEDGRDLLDGDDAVLCVDAAEATVVHRGLPTRPVLSFNRRFSVPAIIEHRVDDATRAFLLANDSDPFNRWEAGRRYALNLACRLAEPATVTTEDVPGEWATALEGVAGDGTLDPQFRALLLELPGNDEVAAEIASSGQPADPDRIHAALTAMRAALGRQLGDLLPAIRTAMATDAPYSPYPADAGRRALGNRALSLMLASGDPSADQAAEAQYDGADNMTERLSALTLLTHFGRPGADARLADFRATWQADELVMDKWFAVQATAPVPDALNRVVALTEHPAFNWKRPNRFRSLVATFAMANPVRFHAGDGAGYNFLVDWLLRLDRLNPQTAARVTGAFESWRRYDDTRQAHARTAMQRLADDTALSRNTREIVERLLAG
ncbi:MAG: DUF3458 domain-containing protein, partial [Pseudomonadota bacterium]